MHVVIFFDTFFKYRIFILYKENIIILDFIIGYWIESISKVVFGFVGIKFRYIGNIILPKLSYKNLQLP